MSYTKQVFKSGDVLTADALNKMDDQIYDLTENVSNLKGIDGKTAYEFAKDGGYTGTESEFAAKLAADAVSVTYDESTKTLNISSVSGGVTAEQVSEIAESYDVEKIVLDGIELNLSIGSDGYTPIKGIDYWTDKDKEEIVEFVLNELPVGNEVEY